jgi:hypothetical protein
MVLLIAAPVLQIRRVQVNADTALNPVRVTILPGNRVDRKNAAKALGREPKTLAEWKSRGIGPKPVKVGGRVFYDWAEVQAFAGVEA